MCMDNLVFKGVTIRHVCTRLVAALLLTLTSTTLASTGALVAAASSLRTLWPNLIAQYTKDTGEPAARVSFASSGLLASQIQNGAPFELFLSADQLNVQRLQKQNLTSDDSVVFATGNLALIAHADSTVAQHLSIAAVSAQITALDQTTGNQPAQAFKITMPNPIHAPYGKAARMALQNAGAWPIRSGHLLAAENASQALQFVRTGAVDVGLVPLALLSNPPETIIVESLESTIYEPVDHTMTRLLNRSSAANRLFAWLQTDSARSIFLQHGLDSPQTITDDE